MQHASIELIKESILLKSPSKMSQGGRGSRISGARKKERNQEKIN